VTEYCIQWWVSPEGSRSGKGTRERPWDIETALSHPAEVEPGDLIWVLGGKYRPRQALVSALRGSEKRPIVLRVEPGARAVLDFVESADSVCLHVKGAHTWYWGLEITNSSPARWSDVDGTEGNPRGTGILSEGGPGTKYIHLRIHDVGASLFESQPSGLEIYGCLLFNSYWVAPDRSHGPGMYVRNQPAWPRKRIENNIVFQHGRQGLQGFGSVPFANFDVVDNIWFNNGIGPEGLHRNLMFGNASDQHLDNIFERNWTYFSRGGGTHQFNMFGGDGGCHNLTLRDNVFAAAGRIAVGVNRCDAEQVRGNRVVGGVEYSSFDGRLNLSGEGFRSRFSENEFNGDGLGAPAGTWVYVVPDRYLPDAWDHRGAARVAVYNWDGQKSVAIDLSGVEAAGRIEAGTTVTVRPAQNLEQTVERVFDGLSIEIPMTGWTVASPYGRDLLREPLPDAFPEFGAFVLDWPMEGPAPPESPPRVIEDPGRGLSVEEARNARDAAWRTRDPDERERLRLERLYAWRLRTLGQGE
jgi:hypothetical protein